MCHAFESGKQSLPASAAVPGVRARVAPGCNLGQPTEVMGPAFRMAGAFLGTGQAGVGQPQQRSVRLPDQVDLDQARPRRYHLAAVPAEAVGQAVHRYHLAKGAASETSAGDIDEIEPPRLRLDLRLRFHPAQNLLWIGQEGEHRGGRRRDARLAVDDEGLLHRSLLRLLRPAPPEAEDGDGLSAWAPKGESDKCGGIPMDSLITAAARALAAGDPLGALNRVALRDDAPALALRGIAMAQLGDLVRAKALMRSAARLRFERG